MWKFQIFFVQIAVTLIMSLKNANVIIAEMPGNRQKKIARNKEKQKKLNEDLSEKL